MIRTFKRCLKKLSKRSGPVGELEKHLSTCIPYQMPCLHPKPCNNIEQIQLLIWGCSHEICLQKS